MTSEEYLKHVMILADQGADIDEPFWYLSGPMTGYPQHNFPAFEQAAQDLRALGYNLVSPAELDDADVYATAINDLGGEAFNAEEHAALLARDLIIVALPNCVGCMVLEGWEDSVGAQAETYVADVLGKSVMLVARGWDNSILLQDTERAWHVNE